MPKEKIEELNSAILKIKENIRLCNFCFLPFEKEGELCEICQNPNRNKSLLCLVEKESDLLSIEKTKKYNGLYFILGGTISVLKKSDIEKLRFKELEERVKNPSGFNPQAEEIKEIIIATNATTEGQATALYLERLLKPFNMNPSGAEIKITRLGRGLPVGAELEYADEETLSSALENRR